jgi:hypothetical protein
MEGADRTWWKSLGTAVFMVAAAVFAAFVTFAVLPDRVALVTDYVGVEGTVVETPERERCGESDCLYADVRYPDAEGNTWVRRMRVGDDAAQGDSISVRLPKSDPTGASTDSGVVAWIFLLYAVALGPLILVGVGWEALTSLWRRLRRIGEVE